MKFARVRGDDAVKKQGAMAIGVSDHCGGPKRKASATGFDVAVVAIVVGVKGVLSGRLGIKHRRRSGGVETFVEPRKAVLGVLVVCEGPGIAEQASMLGIRTIEERVAEYPHNVTAEDEAVATVTAA